MIEKGIRKKIIISADDFGKSKKANENILRLAEEGKIDRVSVMANGNFDPGEIERIKKAAVKLDIHLDLADVPKKEKKLKKGLLGRGILFLIRHIGSPAYRKKRIREKWLGQMERFKDIFGRYPDGVNSHQHVHLFGRYFKLSLELSKEYGSSYFRFAKKELLGSRTNIRRIIYILWKSDKKSFLESGLSGPDNFSSLDWIDDLDGFLGGLPAGTSELACHPERDEEFNIIKKYF